MPADLPAAVNAATLPIAEEQGQAFWRAAEAALAVHDRYQFFVWLRLHLHRFIPHDLALCQFAGHDGVQLFYSVPLPRPLLDALPEGRSRFWRGVREHWSSQGSRAALLPLAGDAGGAGIATDDSPEGQALREAGFDALAVHGIGPRSRVRPEALFAFALRGSRDETRTAAAHLELWLPALYCTAMRAIAPAPAPAPAVVLRSEEGDEVGDAADGRAGSAAAVLTGRELQVLAAVRDAKRNAQIGELLGISPLTVKNHLRKIMRKLNAGNRAQAVAEAMARRLIA